MEIKFVRTFPIGPAMIALFAALFLGLLAVAVWDVNNIVNNYIYDNRATLVKLKTVNDTFPFVGKVRVCLYYKNPSFGDWQKYTFSVEGYDGGIEGYVLRTIDQHYVRDIRPMEEYRWTGGIEDDAHRRELLQFAGYVQLLDKIGPRLVNITHHYAAMKERSIVVSAVDEYLATPNITGQIKQVWSEDGDTFDDSNTDRPAKIKDVEGDFGHGTRSVDFDKVGRDHVCFNLRIGDYLKKGERLEYAMNYITRNASLGALNTDDAYPTRAAEVQIFYPYDTRIYKSGLKENISFDVIEVTITNSAVIDRSEFYDCTSTHETEEECLDEKRSRTIGRVCGCTPFSIALKDTFLNAGNGTSADSTTDLCSVEVYDRCWDRADEEATKVEKETREAGTCVPCTVPKNNFRVAKTTYKDSIIVATRPMQPLAIVNFECTDKDYFYFLEQAQNSRSQLVSQIGGDLGLYIGFSMVSIVQLCLFLYHMQRHHSECDCGAQSSTKYKRWFRFGLCYMFRTLEIANVRCAAAKEEAKYEQVTDRVKWLEAEKKQTTENIERMKDVFKEEIASLRKELLQQRNADEYTEITRASSRGERF